MFLSSSAKILTFVQESLGGEKHKNVAKVMPIPWTFLSSKSMENKVKCRHNQCWLWINFIKRGRKMSAASESELSNANDEISYQLAGISWLLNLFSATAAFTDEYGFEGRLIGLYFPFLFFPSLSSLACSLLSPSICYFFYSHPLFFSPHLFPSAVISFISYLLQSSAPGWHAIPFQ
jgi:hypothetical protein